MSAAILEPDRANALRTCRSALRRVANYQLDPQLDRWMLEMGERKEFLDSSQHAELMSLVAFTQQRSLEKLEAQLALKRLESAYPNLADEA